MELSFFTILFGVPVTRLERGRPEADPRLHAAFWWTEGVLQKASSGHSLPSRGRKDFLEISDV